MADSHVSELLQGWANSQSLQLVVESQGKLNSTSKFSAQENCPSEQSETQIAEWDSRLNTVCIATENGITGFVLPCYDYADETLRKYQAVPDQNKSLNIGSVSELKHPGNRVHVKVKEGLLTTFGRRNDAEIPCWHKSASETQAFLFSSLKLKNEFWLFNADVESGCPLFVNGQPVWAQRLDPGDLLQVGEYLWEWSASDGFLVPVDPISGATVLCKNFEQTVEFKPGELVAVTGKSGAGKSTLIKRIINCENRVKFLTDSVCEVNPYDEVGYVSQDRTLHYSLKVLDTIKFNADLRNQSDVDVESILRQVGLKSELWGKRIDQLSGGEARRVQIATELVHSPGLLLLDEPTKGLDSKLRSEIFRILKSIALRGASVVVVTHAQDEVPHFFDRELVVENFRVIEDEPCGLTAAARKSRQSSHESTPMKDSKTQSQSSKHMQIGTLLRREFSLILASWVPTLLVGCFILPAVFALSISFAIPNGDKLRMAGFLHILACIWMGASSSILSIAAERSLFEHERKLFLRSHYYLIAKSITRSMLVLIQVAVFLLSLFSIAGFVLRDGSMDHYWASLPSVSLTLVLAGVAASNLGLLISGFSHRSVNTANIILPMVMMAQIVFSTAVSQSGKIETRTGYIHVVEKQVKDRSATVEWLPVPAQFTLSWHADILLRNAVSVVSEDLSDQESEKRLMTDLLISASILILWLFLSILLCWFWLATFENRFAKTKLVSN